MADVYPKENAQVAHSGVLDGWDVALQAAALVYCATPHTVTGHTPFSLVTGQEVILPLSRECYEPALCPLGVTWLEALWRRRAKDARATSRREC